MRRGLEGRVGVPRGPVATHQAEHQCAVGGFGGESWTEGSVIGGVVGGKVGCALNRGLARPRWRSLVSRDLQAGGMLSTCGHVWALGQEHPRAHAGPMCWRKAIGVAGKGWRQGPARPRKACVLVSVAAVTNGHTPGG